MEKAEEPGETQLTRARHIKKRSLKNKALSVSFDEKDLRDFVTGFHKRKKKRRKEAEVQLQEVHRRKRIEARKKRKLERELVYGGGPAETSGGPDEAGEDAEQDEDSEPVPSISVEATALYESGDMRVTVTTSEISREEELPIERPPPAALTSTGGGYAKKQHQAPVNKKKPLKRVAKNRPRRKQQKKRDVRKGKTMNSKPRLQIR